MRAAPDNLLISRDGGTELVGRLFIGGLLTREASLDPFPHGRTYTVD